MRPLNPSTSHAQATRAAVSLEAEVVAVNPAYGLVTLAVTGGLLHAAVPNASVGERKRLNVYASNVSIACETPSRSSILNIMSARVLGAEQPNSFDIIVALGLGEEGRGATILARLSKWSWDSLQLSVGADVFAQVKAIALEPLGGRQPDGDSGIQHTG